MILYLQQRNNCTMISKVKSFADIKEQTVKYLDENNIDYPYIKHWWRNNQLIIDYGVRDDYLVITGTMKDMDNLREEMYMK